MEKLLFESDTKTTEKSATLETQKIETNFKYAFVGLGGCGCNIALNLADLGFTSNIYAINTDALHLRSMIGKNLNKLLIGKSITRGLGAGGNPEIGKRAIEESLENIAKLFTEHKLVFLVCGLGGGTGTGAIIPLAKRLREMNLDVIAIVTLPFAFERAKRKIAIEYLPALKEVCNSVIVFDNEVLGEKAANLGLAHAFSLIDSMIAKLINQLDTSLNRPSLMNIDYSDLSNLLKVAPGYATFNLVSIEKREALIDLEDRLKNDFIISRASSANGVLLMLEAHESIPIGDAIHVLSVATEGINEKAEIAIGIHLVPNQKTYATLFTIWFGTGLDIDS